jgi:hypothetical protein
MSKLWILFIITFLPCLVWEFKWHRTEDMHISILVNIITWYCFTFYSPPPNHNTHTSWSDLHLVFLNAMSQFGSLSHNFRQTCCLHLQEKYVYVDNEAGSSKMFTLIYQLDDMTSKKTIVQMWITATIHNVWQNHHTFIQFSSHTEVKLF